MTTNHQRLTCEFQLLRYVPNPVRDEFVHVGVLLREQGAAQTGVPPMELRFTRDWRWVRCLLTRTQTLRCWKVWRPNCVTGCVMTLTASSCASLMKRYL